MLPPLLTSCKRIEILFSTELLGSFIKSLIKLLTKKFGILPSEIRSKIENSEVYNLEIAMDEFVNLEKLEDVLKFLA